MEPQTGAWRSIFCDTLRHPRFSTRMPPFSRGIPPFGVRTFLYPKGFRGSDRPPRARLYYESAVGANPLKVAHNGPSFLSQLVENLFRTDHIRRFQNEPDRVFRV